MRKIAMLLLFTIILNNNISLSFAGEEEDEYTANDKFTRGAVNMATFYLEVPKTIYDTSVEENPITGLLYGLPMGFAKGLVRFAIGVVELGTFPFEPYGPLIEPEFLMLEK